MKKVCVLIVNYMSYGDTLRYVGELKKQQGIDLSILIVDNCSPNGSFEMLQKALHHDDQVHIIQSACNGGYAYGNNTGLQHIKGWDVDFLVISNNDLHLADETLIARLIDAHDRLDRPALVAPRMFVNGREDVKHQAWRLPRLWDDLVGSLRSTYWVAERLGLTNRYHFDPDDTDAHPVDCLSGSFFLCRKSLLYGIGGFDEHTFLYGEETILALRIRKRGLRNYLIRGLRYDHEKGNTTYNVVPLPLLRRYWVESTCYYHRRYRRGNWLGAVLLWLLYYLWIMETRLLRKTYRKEGKKE